MAEPTEQQRIFGDFIRSLARETEVPDFAGDFKPASTDLIRTAIKARSQIDDSEFFQRLLENARKGNINVPSHIPTATKPLELPTKGILQGLLGL